MEKKVILISKKSEEASQIDAILSKNNYRSHLIENVDNLNKELINFHCNCVIFNLDSICVDNRTIRELTIQYPKIYFLCMSRDRFHPELKDAICYHIFACLTKPLDYDELLYWLRCIDDNESDSKPVQINSDSKPVKINN